MMDLRIGLLVLGALLGLTAAALDSGSNRGTEITDMCLGCICEATTNCNMTFQCVHDLCGPLLLSPPYWEDAGRPVILNDNANNPGAFHRCALDPYCAANAVRNYMRRFGQDCNGDRVLDCDDYARIHYMGGYQCRTPIDNALYYKVFSKCLESVNRLNG